MIRRALVPILAFCTLPAAASAQLQATQWYETTNVQANELTDQNLGLDIAIPETVISEVSDGVAGSAATVNHGPPGPPSGTAGINAYSELAGSDLTAVANMTVNFFARLIQTSPPPVSVTTVPVSFSASGTVNASGTPSIQGQCLSNVTILLGLDPVLTADIRASNNPGSGYPTSDSFDESTVSNVALGDLINASLIAQASVTAFGADAGSVTATAFVDPVIEVMDQTIPGTSSSYRDYFEVEFGPGYYALGNPTPVVPTTWGDIKTRYE